ncbi:ATP-dependent DNA ligase [Paenibacillus hexagrammi]|uniref:DNA ligase (ATP) n=1 Tax=Paenibacillus hexagrammi TaxID=2908839 RepID=A0ABY3SKL5_9BACL|nr:RNA ligase family protein [Paenibacillus sp. YPD9-1]UJF34249.1 DNA ligase [Paenibacillus sp. YPD9-1]
MKLEPVIPFEPMSASQAPAAAQWIHQVKWDGVRMLVYYESGECRLFNRKRNERTMNYPELTDVSVYCKADSVILDGEIIALAADGKPSFHEVMRRDGVRRAERIESSRRAVPIAYMVFDVLYLNGEWVTDKPLSERIDLLTSIIIPNQTVQVVPAYPNGQALFDLMKQQGMEGIISKDTSSAYACDRKDQRWVKVKNYGDVIAVIGGFTLNGGIVNAVLVGVYDDQQRLHFIGHVGTGKMPRKEWAELTDTLKPMVIAAMPFCSAHPDMKGAYWVKPQLAVKIQYTEWRYKEGRTLRQPSIQAFVDVPPQECIFR